MKLKRHVKQAGFSLIELMVVISIIAILAGLMAAALPGIQNTINRNNTKQFLAEIEAGLSSYQIDNGIYPQNPATGERVESGILGSAVLYESLSGDRDKDGLVDDLPDTKVYVEKLDWESNRKNSKNPKSYKAGSDFYVIDTYGDPIFYLAEPPNIEPDERKTYNPTFDLWSSAGEDATNPEKQASWITNWQSK